MKNQKPLSKVFNIENCVTVEHIRGKVYDCLAVEQAHLCGNSLHFGNDYLCIHFRQKEFSEREMPSSDIPKPDDQE